MTLKRLYRLAAMLLVPFMFSSSYAFAAKKPADPAVMKAKIEARGVGQGVRVVFADKTEATGLIAAIDDHSFTLKPKKAADVQQIEYAQLTGVYHDRLTRGQKVGITVGIVGVAVAIIAVVFIHKFNNSLKRPIL